MPAIFSKIGKLGHGKQQVRLLGAVERGHDLTRQREAFWQDSDDLIHVRVNRDVPANHLQIGRVAARPYSITQNYDVRAAIRSEEHTSELQSPDHLVSRLLLEKKNTH